MSEYIVYAGKNGSGQLVASERQPKGREALALLDLLAKGVEANDAFELTEGAVDWDTRGQHYFIGLSGDVLGGPYSYGEARALEPEFPEAKLFYKSTSSYVEAFRSVPSTVSFAVR